ncbi:hypothetical protein [Pedobacter sp. NJ-S-72]
MNETDVLKQYWGFNSFRPLQQDIIQAVLEGKDVMRAITHRGREIFMFPDPCDGKRRDLYCCFTTYRPDERSGREFKGKRY